MRTARDHNKKHCDFIRSLPCLLCKNNTATECAHIRMADPRIAKPITGIGIRPDDKFTLPLCSSCHRKQHHGGERKFWEVTGIDPLLVALALYSVSGDIEEAERIIYAQG